MEDFPVLPQKKKQQTKIIDQITPDQATSVLRNLWHAYPDFRVRIESEIKNELTAVNCYDVASDVESSLDSLDEEELYDRSGPTRNGYHDPGEMAGIMVEEALAPYQDQLNRYYEMGMHCEAKELCKGVLKGLYEYARNSDTPFSQYATDSPAEMFGWILDEWNKKNKKKVDQMEMKEFIDKECSDWSKYKWK
jgi:hypothetical protein